MIILSDIKNKRGSNPGGSVKVSLIAWQDVKSIPQPSAAGVITGTIEPKAGKRFAEWEFLPGKCKIGSKSSGDYFGQALDLSVSGDEPEKLKEFEQMIGGLFIAVVELASGRGKVLGNMLCPLKCNEIEWESGGDTGDLNGTGFRFASRGGMPPDYRQTAWRAKESSAYCVTQ